MVPTMDRQPLQASVNRLREALDGMGEPLSAKTLDELKRLEQSTDDKTIAARIQALLDPLCIAAVHINPESRVM